MCGQWYYLLVLYVHDAVDCFWCVCRCKHFTLSYFCSMNLVISGSLYNLGMGFCANELICEYPPSFNRVQFVFIKSGNQQLRFWMGAHKLQPLRAKQVQTRWHIDVEQLIGRNLSCHFTVDRSCCYWGIGAIVFPEARVVRRASFSISNQQFCLISGSLS